jgi:branched-chain amino acid transport system ATP-binding protein
MGISDRVVVLNYGKVIADGPPAEITAHPDVIRAYLGSGHAGA